MAKRKRPKVYAVDFDGTIVENKFPWIGKVKPKTVEFMNKAHARGDRIVIWTSRHGKHLEHAENFLKRKGIPFHEINVNSKFKTGGPKIVADYYIDDKAVHVDDIEKVAQKAYSAPWNVDELTKKYPALLNDPVHRWRAENGIELIHKEPTKKELKRIYKNWMLMGPDKQKISDDKSKELFGLTNKEHYEKLIKTAKLNSDVKLYPHQQRVVDDPEGSKIIAHAVGSGKTLTSIAKFERMREEGRAHKALVVVPAGLRENFGHKNVKKYTNSKYNIVGTQQERKSKKYGDVDPNSDYNILSYDIYKKNPEKYLAESGADTVISDESHRGKNEGTVLTDAMKRARKLYRHHLALTGSAISNTPSDIQPLIDVVSGGKHGLGKSKEEFERKFVKRHTGSQYKGLNENRKPITGFKNTNQLNEDLGKYVDYVDFDQIKDLADMPGKKLKVKKVQISKEQAKIYKKILKSDPAMMQLITRKRLETLKDDETARAFSKLVESRKLMNSVGSVHPGMSLEESAFKSPKTKQLLDDLQLHLGSRKDAKALLFSHLINGGVDVLEAGLKDRGIDYGEFIGKGNPGVTEESRQEDIVNYNKDKKKVMVISSAGGEGLSLGNTTWEGVLDPHYNPEKMKQMEARGIRSGGLGYLPKDQREVEVNRYIATMPKFLGLFGSSLRTPDEFIYDIAQHKDTQNQKLYNLLKDISKKRKNHLVNRQITVRTELPQPSTYEP